MNNTALEIVYKNYKGKISKRRIIPQKIEFGLTPNISEPEWLMWAYDLDKEGNRAFVIRNIQSTNPTRDEQIVNQRISGLDRHFCVTTYILNEDQTKLLLLKHKKLGKWLPPGGHIDANELPEEAARREVQEETGLTVQLESDVPEFKGGMHRPEGLQLNPIVEGQHEHMDFIFKAFVPEASELLWNQQESDGLQWFSIEEVLDENFETFPSIKYWAEKFSQVQSTKKLMVVN